MTMPDDFNPNAPEPEEKCCPCCGFDPEEDKRKDRRLDELEAGAMAAILVELRAIRQLLIQQPRSNRSIYDRELPDWGRYEQHPIRGPKR